VTVVRSANYLRAIVPLFLSALDLVRDPLKGRAFLGRDAPKPEEAARGVGDGLAELEEVVRRDVEAASRHEQRADQTPRAPEDAFLGSPIQPFRELPICRASLLDPSRARDVDHHLPFSGGHPAFRPRHFQNRDEWQQLHRFQRKSLEPLMILFAMVVIDEFLEGPPEVALTEWPDPIEALVFNRPHEPFSMGVRIGAPEMASARRVMFQMSIEGSRYCAGRSSRLVTGLKSPARRG
jgi:hypothetical protein